MIVAVMSHCFVYWLIREAADPDFSKSERGLLVRALAGLNHAGPGGVRVGWADASMVRSIEKSVPLRPSHRDLPRASVVGRNVFDPLGAALRSHRP